MTDIQAYNPSPGILDYAATKGAIAAFTKSLPGLLSGVPAAGQGRVPIP